MSFYVVSIINNEISTSNGMIFYAWERCGIKHYPRLWFISAVYCCYSDFIGVILYSPLNN